MATAGSTACKRRKGSCGTSGLVPLTQFTIVKIRNNMAPVDPRNRNGAILFRIFTMVNWVKGTNPEVPQEPLHRLHAVLPAVATELGPLITSEEVLEKLDGKEVTRKAIIRYVCRILMTTLSDHCHCQKGCCQRDGGGFLTAL